jgi:diguanylate cyclase
MRQRLGLMYNGAALQACRSPWWRCTTCSIAIEGVSYRLLILAVVLQVAVVASLLGFRAILIANHNHEQHMRADPKPRAGARPSCSR